MTGTIVDLNGISINYLLEGKKEDQLVVLINGLADDVETWGEQVPALLAAGYRVLRYHCSFLPHRFPFIILQPIFSYHHTFPHRKSLPISHPNTCTTSYDNRGIGHTSRPQGPYTADLLADDLHALLEHLHVTRFHLLGISMGGMIAQAYALRYPNSTTTTTTTTGPEMLTLTLACTYAAPSPFCSRMFDLWADMATHMSVQTVMRDVVLWCFTVPFFRTREDEAREVDEAMRELDMATEPYLAQLNVIQKFDSTKALEGLKAEERVPGNLGLGDVCVLAGEEDILIPVVLSKELSGMIEGAVWKTCRGGHGCSSEFPEDFNKTYIGFLDSKRASSTKTS